MRKNLNNKNDLIGFLPPFTKFKKMNVDIKCCIVRDPIKRFISTYKNRILFHKDKNFFNHSIDLIIEKLENNLIENKHFLPQTYWLGNNLSYFTFIGKTNDLSDFINNINKFFGQNIRFPWIQTGGKKINVHLNSDQQNKIKKIYEEDYFLLKDVNFQNIAIYFFELKPYEVIINEFTTWINNTTNKLISVYFNSLYYSYMAFKF